MKKIIYSIALIFISQTIQAQLLNGSHFYGEDAFLFSEIKTPAASARALGMGGAFTALGGDASSIHANPAGLGFYNRSEFSFSINSNNSETTSNYISNNNLTSFNSTKLNQISLVFAFPGDNQKRRSSFGVAYNTLRDYSSDYTFSGVNNTSSLQDNFAEFANSTGVTEADLQNEFNFNTWTADTNESLYYNAYLIEPHPDGGFVVGEQGLPVTQNGRNRETGSLGQIDFSYGVNLDDKIYLGASLGIRTLNYIRTTDFDEAFPAGSFINSYNYRDELEVTGTGINLTVGGILRASNDLNIGASITSPTFMSISETLYSSINNLSISDNTIDYNSSVLVVPLDYEYSMVSPFKGQIGVGYFLPNKIGIISAEAEFVGYTGMNVKDEFDPNFSTDQKREIKRVFNNTLNLKAGTELRFSNARVRAGVNYLGDPTADASIDQSQFSISAGVGYRAEKFFIDLGYIRYDSNFAYTPYTLNDATSYASALNSKTNNTFRLSLGTFF